MISGIFTSANLPSNTADLERVVYGATIQQRVSECHQYDRFLFNNMDSWIYVAREDDCYMMLVGAMRVDRYNYVLDGLDFRGTYVFRTKIEFAYVYWANVNIREMIIDMTTHHVYSPIRGSIAWNNPTTYGFFQAKYQCNIQGFYPTEITSSYEMSEVQRGIGNTKVYLGATRSSGPGTDFAWATSHTAFTFWDWYPREPNDPAKECMVLESGGGWKDAVCNVYLPAVSCETD